MGPYASGRRATCESLHHTSVISIKESFCKTRCSLGLLPSKMCLTWSALAQFKLLVLLRYLKMIVSLEALSFRT